MSIPAVDSLAAVVHDALLTKEPSKNYFVSALGIHALLVSVLRNAAHMSEGTVAEVEKVLGSSKEEFPRIVADFDAAVARLSEDTAFAAAGWIHPEVMRSPAIQDFRKVSPPGGAQIIIPSQAELDAWVSEKSLGIIEQFPEVDQNSTLVLLANVLATDIKWAFPYKPVPAPAKLSGWGVGKVLASSSVQKGHSYAVVRETADGPLLGISRASSAKSGVSVLSMIGDLPERDLLRVAEKYADDPGLFLPVALPELVGADLPDWLEVEEVRPVEDEKERYDGFLPAWEAGDTYELSKLAELSVLNSAVREGVLGSAGNGLPVAVTQVVKASYFAEGFKAAALTTAMIGRSAVFTKKTILRATLFFHTPYAVVAVDDKAGLSVFSGVIREATEA